MNHSTQFLIPFWMTIIAGFIARVWIRSKSIRLLNQFREVGANSEEHAIPLKEIKEKQPWIFDRFVTDKILVPTCDGRYYLDEETLRNCRKRRKAIKLIALGFVILAFIFTYSLRK